MANGEQVTCTSQFSNTPWSVEGYVFHSDLKVLNLPCYDLIQGYD